MNHKDMLLEIYKLSYSLKDIKDVNKETTVFIKSIGEKTANVYSVTADLTIKGKTEPVKFELNVAGNTASAALKVNRTKYDIKYGSGSFFSDLGDKTISDDFDLNVKLAF